jgi:hypothetical protein
MFFITEDEMIRGHPQKPQPRKPYKVSEEDPIIEEENNDPNI